MLTMGGGNITFFSFFNNMKAEELEVDMPVIFDNGQMHGRNEGHIAFICDEYISLLLSAGCRLLIYAHDYKHLSINKNGQIIPNCGYRSTARYADPKSTITQGDSQGNESC